MGHILSQQEIDALLAALPAEKSAAATTGPTEKVVKPYDFMRPDKFSKEQIRTLEMMHENFARRVGSNLSAYLRTLLQVNLISVEQEIYEEYAQQLPQPSVLAVVSLEPLEGRAILELNMQTAYSIIDRLLGGSGRPIEPRSQLSDIEQSLIDGVLSLVLQQFSEAWASVGTIVAKLEDIAYTPQFLQVALGTDVVLTVRFEMRIGDFSGSLSLCVPYTAIEPIAPKLSARSWFMTSRKQQSSSARGALRGQIERVRLPLAAVLGAATVTVDDLIRLQVGDVIPLETGVKDELDIVVAGELKYRGRPGTTRRRLGIKITSVVAETTSAAPEVEDEEDEEVSYVS